MNGSLPLVSSANPRKPRSARLVRAAVARQQPQQILHPHEPVEEWRRYGLQPAAAGTRQRYEAWLAMRNAFAHWRREGPRLALTLRMEWEAVMTGAWRQWWIFANTERLALKLHRQYIEEIEAELADDALGF